MNFLTLGDMAHSFAMQRRHADLRQEMQGLSDELSSGRKTDIARHLRGEFSHLAGLERQSARLDGFRTTAVEAGLIAGGMQDALSRISELASEFSGGLIAGAMTADVNTIGRLAGEAGQVLDTMMSSLNARVAGQALFAGDEVSSAALMDADVLRSALAGVVSGLTTAADVEAALDAWFDDPSGFDAVIYTGSAAARSPIRLSDRESATLDVTGRDPALKSLLKSAALAELAGDASLGLAQEERRQLMLSGGDRMLSAQSGIVGLQAVVGQAEAVIEAARARNESEALGLAKARNALISADPYEAATKLEAAQFQLESLYAVTVRMSQLSLVNFLR